MTHPATLNMIGQKFGRLTVLERAPNQKAYAAWFCSCSCGVIKTHPIRGFSLRNGSTTSCGCILREILHNRNFKHGHSCRIRKSPEYISWDSMKQRCTNPKHRFYRTYGGAGVSVCNKWLKFENFYTDVGPRPGIEYSIGRIKNNLNYEPGNCKWMTVEEQSNNRSTSKYVTINNTTKTVAQWCRFLNIDTRVVNSRIHRGRSPIEAITVPIRKYKMPDAEKSRIGRSNSRRGKSQERHVAHMLSDWSGVEFRRRRVEGRSASVIARESTADVIATPHDFRFSVEAKSGKRFSLDALMASPTTALFSSWWFQTCYDAQLMSKAANIHIFPMLFFKPNPSIDWIAFSLYALEILLPKDNGSPKTKLWFPHIRFTSYESKQIGAITFSKKNKITSELQLDPVIFCRWKDFAINVSPNGLFVNFSDPNWVYAREVEQEPINI